MIHLDGPLGQQLLDVALGQPVSQIPARRHRDHLTREPIASRAHDATFDRIIAPVWLTSPGPANATSPPAVTTTAATRPDTTKAPPIRSPNQARNRLSGSHAPRTVASRLDDSRGYIGSAQLCTNDPTMPRRLQRTPAPRRAPPTQSSRSHTLAIPAVCALPRRQRDLRTRSREHGRRRARAVVHRHPRQPPHRGVDSRCVSAAGSSAGTTPPPRHATLPLSSRTRFVPIRTRHSTISPAARLTAEQPPAGHAGHHHRDRVPLDRACPATRPAGEQRHHIGRTVRRPAPGCGATTARHLPPACQARPPP
jgi:hypothetical protein